MIGVVVNYRRGRHTINTRHVILHFQDVDTKEKAAKLIGKNVLWVSPGKRKFFIGKIVDTHGNKGNVRAIFKKGLPGQALGDVVFIVEDVNALKELRQKIKEAKDINQVRKILFDFFKQS